MTSNGFEIVCSDEMMKKLEAHCFSETKVEVGGFILGHIEGEKATVTAVLPAKQAVGQSTQLTFTHESWNVFHEESKGLDGTLIGWFHSHPNFGVFLSDHDKFIQENFFKQDGNITIVIDPIRGRRGWFYSSNGKIVKYGKETDTTREKLGRSSTNADENIEVVMGQSSGNVTMGKVLLIAFMSTVLGGFLGYGLNTMSSSDTTSDRLVAIENTIRYLAQETGVDLNPQPVQTEAASPSPTPSKSKAKSPAPSTAPTKKAASTAPTKSSANTGGLVTLGGACDPTKDQATTAYICKSTSKKNKTVGVWAVKPTPIKAETSTTGK